jgi:hypothetical protein
MDAAIEIRRRYDLDWIRIAAFGLLIFYHVGMLYASWDFHVKSAHRSAGIEALMIAVNPWRLALLFFVSGAASRWLLEGSHPGAFAWRRSLRLLLPLLFGMTAIIPPQSYIEVIEKYQYSQDFATFYRQHYLAFGAFRADTGRSTGLILPTWNHLWFVAYLWAYTLALALLSAFPAAVAWAERVLERYVTDVWLLVAPAALLVLFRLTLFPAFPVTHALIDDGYSHAVFGSVFAFGVLSARSEALWSKFVRLRWIALGMALAAYAALLSGRGAPMSDLIEFIRALAYGVDQWCFIIAILGFGRHWLGRADSPARRYLTDAMFAFYIVHQTVIVILAHWLKPLGLAIGVEAGALVLGTLLACGIGYEMARRLPILNMLWVLKGEATARARLRLRDDLEGEPGLLTGNRRPEFSARFRHAVALP